MTEITLERLGAGIKAAHEKGDKEAVRKLGQAYRQLEAQQKASPSADGVMDALVYGVDSAGASIGKGLQSIGEMTGISALESAGKAQADSNAADIARRNYQRPEGSDGILSNLMKGELGNAASSLGYSAVESLPSVGVGAVASLGALASAPVAIPVAGAATALGSVMALGDIRSEKEQKGVNPEANWKDIGAAVASGLVELVPAGKAGGFTLSFTKEALQEAGQEGLVIGNTAIQGGEYVPEEVANRIFDAGVTGGVVSKGVEYGVKAVAKPVQAASDYVSRTDDIEVTDDHVRLAERLRDAADGDMSKLANVSTTDAEEGAQSYAKAVLGDLRAEATKIAQDLSALARQNKDREASIAIARVLKNGANLKSTITQENIDSITQHFPDQADAQRLASITNQIKLVTPFTNAKADIGGLSRFTGILDVTDVRGRGFAGGAGVALGLTSGPVGLKALASGVAINRGSQLIDRLTNRRSRIKRFVDSVDKKSFQVDDIQGPTAQEAVEQMRALAQEAQRAAAEKEALAKKAERDFEKQEAADLAAIKRAEEKQAKESAKAAQKAQAQQLKPKQAVPLDQSNADLYRVNSEATAEMFDTGVIPEDNPNPIFQGYSKWKQATGMSPGDTLDVLEQLEREGSVPKDTARRFREDIYSFRKDKSVPAIQELARARGKPDHKPMFTDLAADVALERIKASSVKPSGSRRKHKAKEGERRAQNVVTAIEAGQNALPAPVYRALHKLKEAIDRPDMTAEMRAQLVDETLSQLFPQGPVLDHWSKVFTPLVTIGNDYVIERKLEEEATQEQSFETKTEEVKKKAAKKRTKKPAVQPETPVVPQTPTQLELDLVPTETTADRALQKLAEPKPAPEPQEEKSEADQVEEAQEPKVATLDQSKAEPKEKKAKGRTGLASMVYERVEKITNMLHLAETRGQELADYMDGLPPSIDGRIERIILEMATDQMTVNMIIDTFADRFNLPPKVAADLVFKTLSSWQKAGKVKMYRFFQNDRLKVNGEFQKDEEGVYLEVLALEATDEGLKTALEVAKAVNYTAKMVNQDQPDVIFSPDQLAEGPHKALKDYAKEQIDNTFRPILDFLNDMRMQKFAIHPDILSQIEDALNREDTKKLGTIGTALRPVVKEKNVVGKGGKLTKKKSYDEGPMKAVAQLLFQLGPKEERTDTRIRQEVSAGANGRIYTKNGVAHAQAGDIMKGLLRTDQKHKVGKKSGLKFMFHSFGNLLGFDKKSPLVRREAIFQPGVIDGLLKFANDPFGQNTLVSSKGNPTIVSKLLKDGEGFFQVLNVAHEVKRMVDFAKARNKAPGVTDPAALLKDPRVQADMIKNYETDFIVQLDASNNAYQLAGLVMGNMDVLMATGLQPRPGVIDPDSEAGADIYLEPAKAVVARIPELMGLNLPDSKIRKLFKKSIGTYLYAAEFNSRKESFRKELEAIADGAPIFGVGGTGLIEVPTNVLEGLSGDGFTFQEEHYNVDGDVKETVAVVRRVVEQNGQFKIASKKGNGKETVGSSKYKTQDEAIAAVLEGDLYARMNREMIRDFETRYPEVREYMGFANKVAEIVMAKYKQQVEAAQASGNNEPVPPPTIKVPTPDGIMLEYSFKETGIYTSADVTLDGKPVRLGVKTPDIKLKGRGLSAFMTHQLDAYVLRETYKRMKEKGIKSFNPIHDSFGFHPSDAEEGQKVALEVMQELGNKDFNLFAAILQANGMIAEFQAAGGVVPNRRGVKPMPAKRIPTALS